MASEPKLARGVGTPTRCRSCKAEIVFAVVYTTGKAKPFEKDHAGEWVFENGLAKHVGKVDPQADLFATDKPQRYTSHFANCPQADQWRQPK